MGEGQLPLEDEPAVLPAPAQHLQGQLPDPKVVELALHGELLVCGAAPGPLHGDEVLGVPVHLVEGSLDPELGLLDALPVIVLGRGHLQEAGQEERVLRYSLDRNLKYRKL